MSELSTRSDGNGPSICIVGTNGERSRAIDGLVALGQAFADAAWVGNPAKSIACGAQERGITGLQSLWEKRLAKAMLDYVWRGENGRADILRCAHALAQDVWPHAVALWESSLMDAHALRGPGRATRRRM